MTGDKLGEIGVERWPIVEDPLAVAEVFLPPKGFEVAHAALGSSVRKRTINVYDLSPEMIGSFDVVVCGSILLHLRDPVRALEAIRSVCSGWLLSVDAVSLKLTVLHPRRPTAELAVDDRRCQWWTANAAGHRRMVEMAGFEVTRTVRPFCEPFGASHPSARRSGRSLRTHAIHLAQRLLTGEEGVPHAALLARPTLPSVTPPPIRTETGERPSRTGSPPEGDRLAPTV